jgi:outer membrane protein assembly factor BamE (lipoprotein component of BamABCDE complex)
MRKLLALAAAHIALNGCYFGKKIDDRPWAQEVVDKIKPGKTTKEEVLRMMGPPKLVIRLLESEAYMYVASTEKTSGLVLIILNMSRTDRQYDAVTIIINRQDIVTAVGSRFTANESEYGFPWD